MSSRASKHRHNQKTTKRYPLPDNSVSVRWLKPSEGDYYCPICQEQWFSENTVIWAVYNYFKLAEYAPEPADQASR